MPLILIFILLISQLQAADQVDKQVQENEVEKKRIQEQIDIKTLEERLQERKRLDVLEQRKREAQKRIEQRLQNNR